MLIWKKEIPFTSQLIASIRGIIGVQLFRDNELLKKEPTSLETRVNHALNVTAIQHSLAAN